MDLKRAEAAIVWLRQQVSRQNGELPDWSSYKDMVKTYLNDPYNVPFKLPNEYQYAYLRVKGMSHADACERMGLEVEQSARPAAAAKESWWKFW